MRVHFGCLVGGNQREFDEMGARTVASVRELVSASFVGSITIGLLAHHERRRETKARRAGEERRAAPTHPRTPARAVGCAADGIAGARALEGAAATRRSRELTEYMIDLGKARN
jgi:hypothetical protein